MGAQTFKILKKENSPIIIGYMGGHSHKPDLLSIEPVLIDILEKYNDQIQIHFWGLEPSQEFKKIQ